MEEIERRRFTRIRFRGEAHLCVGAAAYPCEVCDLSLKGALVAAGITSAPQLGDDCVLELRLSQDGVLVRMQGEIAHAEPGQLGIVWREIDLDSLTHLRRLLELNLGDPALLERELGALVAD